MVCCPKSLDPPLEQKPRRGVGLYMHEDWSFFTINYREHCSLENISLDQFGRGIRTVVQTNLSSPFGLMGYHCEIIRIYFLRLFSFSLCDLLGPGQIQYGQKRVEGCASLWNQCIKFRLDVWSGLG